MRAEDVRLRDRERRRADRVVGGRPPVVEDQRQPLDQLVARADHAVEPVERVAVPLLERVGERHAADARLRAVHHGRAGRAGERHHGGLEVQRRERLGLARARPEARAPQQPLGLCAAERARVDADRRRDRLQPRRGRGGRERRRGAGGGRRDDGRGRMRRAGRLRLALARPALADLDGLLLAVDPLRLLHGPAALALAPLLLLELRRHLTPSRSATTSCAFIPAASCPARLQKSVYVPAVSVNAFSAASPFSTTSEPEARAAAPQPQVVRVLRGAVVELDRHLARAHRAAREVEVHVVEVRVVRADLEEPGRGARDRRRGRRRRRVGVPARRGRCPARTATPGDDGVPGRRGIALRVTHAGGQPARGRRFATSAAAGALLAAAALLRVRGRRGRERESAGERGVGSARRATTPS